MSLDTLTSIIHARRAYFPKFYIDKPIDQDQISMMLDNANWAPTHKRTEPWRFRVFHSLESRQRLSDFIAADFQTHTPAELFSETKLKDVSEKPLISGCTLAICMQREVAPSLPEWEEIAATAMAVQNIWLTCTALGLGSYWATPGFISRLGPILELKEGEKCLGLFYIGHLVDGAPAPAIRGKVEDKVRWM